MKFEVPDKFCPKCGDRIPAGDPTLDREGKPTVRKVSRLFCECYARMEPRKRRVKNHAAQETILTADCPAIRL
jgi:hypothetical protein